MLISDRQVKLIRAISTGSLSSWALQQPAREPGTGGRSPTPSHPATSTGAASPTPGTCCRSQCPEQCHYPSTAPSTPPDGPFPAQDPGSCRQDRHEATLHPLGHRGLRDAAPHPPLLRLTPALFLQNLSPTISLPRAPALPAYAGGLNSVKRICFRACKTEDEQIPSHALAGILCLRPTSQGRLRKKERKKKIPSVTHCHDLI